MAKGRPLVGATADRTPWTRRDDARLREVYAEGGAAAAVLSFPGRSKAAIFHRAQRLKVKRRKRWTPEDDRRLRDLWGDVSLGQLAKMLCRTNLTTYWRAHAIGLPRGAPQGMELLTHAAKRAGVTTTQLRRVLKAHGIARPRRTMSLKTRGARLRHVVDPLDVDDAFAAWCQQETVHEAALRHDLCDDTLRQWLVDAGHVPPPKRPRAIGKRSRPPVHWRLPSSTIDAVVAGQRRLETLVAASLRVGVGRQTLAVWLAAAGEKLPPKHRVWRVAPEVIDAVVAARRADPKTKAWRPRAKYEHAAAAE